MVWLPCTNLICIVRVALPVHIVADLVTLKVAILCMLKAVKVPTGKSVVPMDATLTVFARGKIAAMGVIMFGDVHVTWVELRCIVPTRHVVVLWSRYCV